MTRKARTAAASRASAGAAVAVPISKLAPPRPLRGVTLRGRLLEALTTSAEKPLTLLVASAGFGKTVLLSSWLSDGGVPWKVAWLTVDSRDENPRRFWTGVLAAVRQSGAVGDKGGLAALAPPRRGTDEEFLAVLMNGLCELDERLILVLDDFHEIGHDGVLEGVDYLLRHAPPQLGVVLAARRDPRLSVTQLRLRREVTEIRATALAFSEEEADELLASAGVDLPAADVGLLVARTEGWAAGLALAVMSLEGVADPGACLARFAGDDRAVADYLASEVVNRLRPDVREFMAYTSVVDDVNAELAEALTGRKDSQEILEELARTNSFVLPIDSRGHRYRFHTLLLELLRSELARCGGNIRLELHRRAAGWNAAHGLPIDAIPHALTAEDWPLAAALVRDHWLDAFISGQTEALRHLFARLPSELAERDPRLALAYAGNSFELGHLSEADRYLRLALEVASGTEGDEEFADTLAFVTLHRARLRGDLDGAVAAARTLLAQRGRDPAGAVVHNLRRRALVVLLLGSAELWTDELQEARRDLRRALGLAREADEDYLVLGCLSHLALLDLVQGRLRTASELAQDAIDLARRRGWSGARAAAPAYLTRAVVQLQWNDPDAIRSIQQASAAAFEAANPSLRVALALAEARIRLRDEGSAGARRGLAVLEIALEQAAEGRIRLPASLDALVRATRPRLLLAVGETDEAAALLERAEPCAAVAAVKARLALANGDPAHALQVLSPHVHEAPAVHLATLLETLVLDAVAHQCRLEREAAAKSLERALALAEPDGFRWPFLQAGAPLRELLTRQIRRGTAHRALVEELLADLHQWSEHGRLVGDAQLLQPLTDREEAVLRYLPTLLSNAEIAAELYVSINTVKAHVKSIYRKLGATRRKDAVLRGRELRLL